MRILRIYPFLPPLPGGMEKHILRLSEEQRKLGCEVTLAFNQGDSTDPSDLQVLRGINLRKVKPQFLRDLVFYGGLIWKLSKERRCFKIVHVHGDWSAFFLGLLVAIFVRAKKQVASVHGVARRGIWGVLYRFVFNNYDVVYATGALDAAYIRSLIEKPVFWQHSGIDADFIGLKVEQERSFDVITVGSFVPIKNLELVIKIAKRMPGYTFVLVGDGPQRADIEEACRRKGITNVTFTGQLAPVDVASTLRRARIFLSTSFSEGTPTALLEAMACGLAIVTSHSNNYDDILKPGQNGYVIEGFEARDYALKIRELLDDSSLLDEMRRCNTEQAMSYNWAAVAKQITERMRVDPQTS